MAEKEKKRNKNAEAEKITAETIVSNIPNVELINKAVFDGQLTYEDFEKINKAVRNEIDEEELKIKRSAEENTNNIENAHKYTDILTVNTEIVNDIKNGNIEKYFVAEAISKNDNSDILNTLHKLAEENNSNAQNILGVCCLSGMNVNIDEEKAVEYLNSAAEQGNTAAQRNLAITLENRQSEDKEKIVMLYEKAAEKNDGYAINNLAVCYLLGSGVKQNEKQAVKYFEKAVKCGDDFAMVNLADCYSLGNGTAKNSKKAFSLYKQAADKGNADGMRNAADCLINGIGTKQNFKAAMELYKQAADKGDTKAQEKYNELSEKLNPQKHTELVVSENEKNEKERKKPTLSQLFDLGKKAEENSKNGDKETEKEEKQKDVREKKKSDVSL